MAGLARLATGPRGRNVMTSLKIWQKLTLIVLLMGVPIGTLAYLFLLSQNQRVAATRSELAGLEYIVPLRQMLEHVSQHRVAQHVTLSGNSSRAQEIRTLREKIEADLQAVEAAERKTAASWDTRPAWDATRAQWVALKEKLPAISAAESLESHNRLILALLDHIQLVGDKSQLLIDFQLDTSYLARSLVTGLVRNAESVGQLVAYSAGAMARQSLQPGEPTQMGFLSRQIRQSGEHMRREFRAAIRYNPKIEHRISATVNSAADSGNAFASFVLDRLANGNPAQVDQNDFGDRKSV